jgi:hypothetical protein
MEKADSFFEDLKKALQDNDDQSLIKLALAGVSNECFLFYSDTGLIHERLCCRPPFSIRYP